MADAKPKKPAANSTKKIVDVKSGGDAASGTSKPVIVTNRPILKDPMMAEVSELTGGLEGAQKPSEPAQTDQAEGAPELKKKVAISVSNHSEPESTDEPTKAEDTQAAAPSKKKLIIKPLTEEAPKKDEPEVKASPEPEPTIADLTKPDPLAEKIISTPEQTEASETAVTKDETKSEPTEAVSKTKETKTPKEKDPVKTEQPAQETDDAAEDKATSGLQPGRSFDEVEDVGPLQSSGTDVEQTGVDEKGNAKKDTKKSRELTAEQQKAIESGQYFLPITTAETRRLRREIAVAVVLVVVMIVVWLNIMLDAGLLELDGVKPLTDFFK